MNELLVMTRIAGRRAAFRAVEIQSVIEIDSIAPVPRAPDFISGLTAMRSRSLTVIDCRKSLGLVPETAPDSRAAVVEIEGHLYALQVDKVEDVTDALSEPDPVPGGFGESWERVALGMVETEQGPALLIDITRMVAGPPSRILKKAGKTAEPSVSLSR
ncbi:chemotaxis protein CheW [Allopontixanthobacter sediminis]|uniref:Chemotaxis protein CheW n=1 Tax=Allopontixanthobacter sediminis TaxID=1689985 RepID=A0A845BBT5_9SPHN|nr:chemotaxis protein CheW [Allopontixanthobacter sediminis]MXP45029.1 chemotaxis protein CheW [Allopontixanthobacter sediminis]